EGGEGSPIQDDVATPGAELEDLGDECSGTLEEPRVDVEDITGEGLAAGWAAEEEGHLAIGNGVLTQVVEDHDAVAADPVTDELTQCTGGVGRDELERSGLGGGGGDDGGVPEGLLSLELVPYTVYGGLLLANTTVDKPDNVAQLGEGQLDKLGGDGGGVEG